MKLIYQHEKGQCLSTAHSILNETFSKPLTHITRRDNDPWKPTEILLTLFSLKLMFVRKTLRIIKICFNFLHLIN